MIFLGIVHFFLIVIETVVNCTKSLAGAPAETQAPATGAMGGGTWPTGVSKTRSVQLSP